MTISVTHVTASDRYAGVEAHIRTLACAQADAGLTVTVIGGDPKQMAPELGAHDVTFSPARNTWELTRAIRTVHTDVIHSHLTAADTAAYLGTRLTHATIVSTRHTPQHRGSTPFRRTALRRVVSRAIAAETAVSSYAAGFVDGPCTVIHAGVPVQPLVSAGERDQIILVAQRMEPEKATSEAVAIVARSGLLEAGWRLHIAGDGSQRPSIEDQINALGIADRTYLLGRVANVRELMLSVGLLVAPCPAEAYGLSVVEAMASGLPAVASAAGGHLETVGATTAQTLYPPGDVAAGARTLAGLAGDPTLRDRLGCALHDAQREKFTVERQLDLTSQVYRSVL